ncbi:MAG: hypothetical protein OTI36_13375 [Beijerinckiaceae bacterium]|nr:hypothetical protein [Beijerinckiaceae bacterium]
MGEAAFPAHMILREFFDSRADPVIRRSRATRSQTYTFTAGSKVSKK